MRESKRVPRGTPNIDKSKFTNRVPLLYHKDDVCSFLCRLRTFKLKNKLYSDLVSNFLEISVILTGTIDSGLFYIEILLKRDVGSDLAWISGYEQENSRQNHCTVYFST